MGKSALASNLPSPCVLKNDMATSCLAVSKDWGTSDGAPTACVALGAVAIWQPLRRTRSGLPTVVSLSSHSRRGVFVAKFLLTIHSKEKLKEGQRNHGKNQIAQKRQLPGNSPGRETSSSDNS